LVSVLDETKLEQAITSDLGVQLLGFLGLLVPVVKFAPSPRRPLFSIARSGSIITEVGAKLLAAVTRHSLYSFADPYSIHATEVAHEEDSKLKLILTFLLVSITCGY